LKVYSDPSVVAYFAGMEGLQPCEEVMFRRWIKRGAAVLDLGVGAGRTTGPLSRSAERYVGVDYSQGMVDACRARYPALELRRADATDLSAFGDAQFDAVVFSFNGIDCIRDDEDRARCLREAARVLREGGVFVLSSHNARALAFWPQFRNARGARILWRVAYAVFASVRLFFRSLSSAAFWKGEGYILDPIHGGLATYVSTPRAFTAQIEAAGLEVVDIVGGRYPEARAAWLTPWWYYACRKLASA
jgi:SAM-dependent methyltransferase